MSASRGGGLIELALPLTNSRGLGQFIRFDYRVSRPTDIPLVVSPHILSMGNPYYTRQALYFLSDVECVIRTMVRSPDTLSEEWETAAVADFRRAADNCLFEYSLKHPESRLTTRSDRPLLQHAARQWVSWCFPDEPEGDLRYLETDGARVGLLDPEATDFFTEVYEQYIDQLYSNEVHPADSQGYRDMWFDDVDCDTPSVKFREPPYTYDELMLISRLMPTREDVILPLFQGGEARPAPVDLARELHIGSLNQEYVEQLAKLDTSKFPKIELMAVSGAYDPILLDFYFSGLRSLSPILEFRDYYSVLEYLFEDATLENAKNNLSVRLERLETASDYADYAKAEAELRLPTAERDQIREVILRYVRPERIRAFLRGASVEVSGHFESFSGRVGEKEVKPLKADSSDLLGLIAERIYEFRNAIFHAKRTRQGKKVRSFRPFSRDEGQVIRYEALLLRVVAQEIITQTELDL